MKIEQKTSVPVDVDQAPSVTPKLPTIRIKLKTKRKKKKPPLLNGATRSSVKKKKLQKLADPTLPPEESTYEVESIIDYKKIDGKPMYLVKWKDWASSYNTWEPYENLKSCTRLLCKFFETRTKSLPLEDAASEIERVRHDLGKITDEEILNIVTSFRNKNGWLQFPKVNNGETDLLLRSVVKSCRDREIIKRLQRELKLQAVIKKRNDQLKALKDWENEINLLNQNNALITVENQYDLEGPPQGFYYINSYIPGKNVVIPDEPPVGCDCRGSCNKDSRDCCGTSDGRVFAYTVYNKLRVPLGTPIYECNKQCKCGPDCSNRVVQNGSKVRLCIFRTNTNCGWGVKTLDKVKKGAYITSYVGEVITSEEAENRGRKYDEEGRTYLFDLDFNDKDEYPYTVDAASLGNVSHFINHSCDPNLSVYAVWINCLDPNIPLLTLFSCKEIEAGEELTFDYLCQPLSSKNDDSSEVESTSSRVLCRCGSDKCRKFLF